jgi:hypothetical protein
MIAAALQLAAAGTTTFAGALTLVLPIGLVIVVLAIWWLGLRRGRTAATGPASGEQPPAPRHGP